MSEDTITLTVRRGQVDNLIRLLRNDAVVEAAVRAYEGNTPNYWVTALKDEIEKVPPKALATSSPPLRLVINGYTVDITRRSDGGITVTAYILFSSTTFDIPADQWRALLDYASPPASGATVSAHRPQSPATAGKEEAGTSVKET